MQHMPVYSTVNNGYYYSLSTTRTISNAVNKHYEETIMKLRLQYTATQTHTHINKEENQYHHHQTKIDRNTKKRILIVDDEPDINLTFKIVLEDNGFKVDSFTAPLLALENFKPILYDLVLIDIVMPSMNGFGLYEEIRKLDNKVKICFLTATANYYYYESFGKEAFPDLDTKNSFIYKPIGNDELVKKVNQILMMDDDDDAS
jgi:CheY-like chemotaxis protein